MAGWRTPAQQVERSLIDEYRADRGGAFDADFVAARMPPGIGQITRIGASTGLRPAESAALMNAIQRVAIELAHLGIPILVHVGWSVASVTVTRPRFRRGLAAI